MPLKIEILTPDDAHKRHKGNHPVDKILALSRRMDQLLDLLAAPVAIRIHSVKRAAPVTRGKTVSVEYLVDHEINRIIKSL